MRGSLSPGRGLEPQTGVMGICRPGAGPGPKVFLAGQTELSGKPVCLPTFPGETLVGSLLLSGPWASLLALVLDSPCQPHLSQ